MLAVGSPGGSTIITTVLGILVNRLDLGMTLAQAIAAPRAAPPNTTPVKAEQGYLDLYGAALTALGHTLTPVGAPGTSAAEIGAATAIEFGPGGLLTAAAEPTRRGGGAATVVNREIGDAARPLPWRGEHRRDPRTTDMVTIDSVDELVGLLGTPRRARRQQGPGRAARRRP